MSDDGETEEVEEVSRHRWTKATSPRCSRPSEGWHRVRNAGPGDGVSVHVLCMTPGDHPHRFWDRSTGRVFAFPFMEVAPDRWRAEIVR